MRVSRHLPMPPGGNGEGVEHPARAAPSLGLLKPAGTKDIALTAILILQCVVMFVATPLAAIGETAWRYTIDLLVLVFALLVIVISRGRTAACIGAVGAGCVLGSALVHIVNPSQATILLMHAAGAFGIAICGYVIARAVFAPGLVTVHRLLGAIVLYLTAALAFGATYRLLWDLMPGTFAGVAADGGEVQVFASMLYFSFVTLTSTGYGDILPLHPIVRSVANLEGVIGQLYPATLVAALVTQHLESRRR
jgi:hypothetical protein